MTNVINHEIGLCRFCSKMLTHAPLQDMVFHGIDVYFCHPCKVEYLIKWINYKIDGYYISYSIYHYINDRLFRFTVSSASTAQLWRFDEPGEVGVRANKKAVFIKGFGFKNALEFTPIPEITPSNIDSKLKTYLLFL